MKLLITTSLFFILTILSFGQAPTANFNASLTTICGGTSTVFTDASSGSISSRSWDFGAGANPATGNGTSATVYYSTAGVKNVRLTVSGPGGFNIRQQSITVTNTQVNTSVFNYNSTSACKPIAGFSLPTTLTPTPNPSSLFPGGSYKLANGITGINEPLLNLLGGTISLSSAAAGAYDIIYMANNGNACYKSSVVIYEVKPGGNLLVSPNLLFCNSVVLGLNQAAGSIQWQYSNPTSGGWQDIPFENNDTYTTPLITVTSSWRARLNAGTCPEVFSPTYTLSIEGVAFAGTATGVLSNGAGAYNVTTASRINVCDSSAFALSITGWFKNLQWESSTNNVTFSNIGGATARTYNSVSPHLLIGQTRYYRAASRYSATSVQCQVKYSNVVTVSAVNCLLKPFPLTTLASSVCLSTASTTGIYIYHQDTFDGIGGITRYNWTFTGGTPATLSSTSATFPGNVRFTTAGIKNIRHEIQGPGPSKSRSFNITVDGLSQTSGIASSAPGPTVCGGGFRTLTVNSTNTSPTINWIQSFDNLSWFNATGGGFNTANNIYTTPGIFVDRYYRAIVRSGQCNAVTTSGIKMQLLPAMSISPVSTVTSVIPICPGGRTNMNISGSNYYTIRWQQTTVPGGVSGWQNVTAGTGFTTPFFGTTFLFTDMYFRAVLVDRLDCATLTSGIFVASISGCPLDPQITYNVQRACITSPTIAFTNNTLTVSGISITGVRWNFGAGATPATLSGTGITYPVNVTYNSIGVKNITLTILGTSGATTTPYIKDEVVFIDAIPTILGFAASESAICAGSNITLSYSAATAAGINWFFSTNNGALWTNLSVTGSNYSTPPLTTSTSYQIRADNGACPIFTTTSINIIVTQPSTVTAFSYGTGEFCNSFTGAVLPSFSYSSAATGTFSVFPVVGMSFTATGGAFRPSTSSEGNYLISFSIPAVGGCPNFDISQAVSIKNLAPVPKFYYGNSPFLPICNNVAFKEKVSTADNQNTFTDGYFFATNGLPINSITGTVLINYTVTSGIYDIVYSIPGTGGCGDVYNGVSLTVTSSPATPAFQYAQQEYCNNSFPVVPLPFSVMNLSSLPGAGFKFIINQSGSNISLNSVTGMLSGDTTTKSGLYVVQYQIPSYLGCDAVYSDFSVLFLSALQSKPIFSYSSTPYCGTLTSFYLPEINNTLTFNGINRGSFSGHPDIRVDGYNGAVSLTNLTVSGTFDIVYAQPDNGACPVRTTSSPISFKALNKLPQFTFAQPNYCNDFGILNVITIDGVINGSYSSSSSLLSVNTSTGTVTLTSALPTGNYSLTYTTDAGSGCGFLQGTSGFFLESKPQVPIPYYSSIPICNANSIPILSISGATLGGSNLTFTISGGVQIFPFNGTIYPTPSDVGIYTVTSILKPNVCGSVSGFAVLTIGSSVIVPTFTYESKQFCNDRLSSVTVSPNLAVDYPGGRYSVIPSDLPLNTATGAITVNGLAIGAGAFRTYDIYYTITDVYGCSPPPKNTSVTISGQFNKPKIAYSSNTICKDAGAIISPSITSPGGSFSANSSNISIDGLGNIFADKSQSGNYIIRYAFPPTGSCLTLQDLTTVTIRDLPVLPNFIYGNGQFCNKSSTIVATSSPNMSANFPNGRFSIDDIDISMNTLTGAITVNGVNVFPGTYKRYNITYDYTDIHGCEAASSYSSLTIAGQYNAPGIGYEASIFCQEEGALKIPTLATSGGSIISSSTNLSINGSGFINTGASKDGTYFVRYRMPVIGVCPQLEAITTVTIQKLPAKPTIGYLSSQFCNENIIGIQAFSNSSSTRYRTPTSFISINTFTGVINNLYNLTPNNYQIYGYIPASGVCPEVVSEPVEIEVTAPEIIPNIRYEKSVYCKDGQVARLNETSFFRNGSFINDYGSGLDLNSVTGSINLQNTKPGVFTITYKVPAFKGCAEKKDTANVLINQIPEIPYISYDKGKESFCKGERSIYPDQNVAGLSFAGDIGLDINTLTGQIRLNTSQEGTRYVTVTKSASNSCGSVSDVLSINITAPPVIPSFTFTGSPYCNEGTAFPDGVFDRGKFTASPGIAFLNSITGIIDLESSNLGGPFTIRYVVNDTTCGNYSAQDTINIIASNGGYIDPIQNYGSLCEGSTVKLTLKGHTGDITWQERKAGSNVWYTSAGTYDKGIFTSEELKDSISVRVLASFKGCRSSASNVVNFYVLPKSEGGVAIPKDNIFEICEEFFTYIKLIDYVGNVQWQFSRDSLTWYDVNKEQNKTAITDYLKTPENNKYGTKQYYRAVTKSSKCDSSVSNIVAIKICESADFVPNALTPGTGDENGFWNIVDLRLRKDAVVKVYNRYGTVVYEVKGNDLKAKPWDGSNLPTGTYWYFIDKKDGSQPLIGDVSIIR
ncbi:MAG: gliding motility-associated C-terminal domain-containing protein [Cytophagales bacterium]|nr:gliding motility-associated C-terminal domain-containing protein [Cytophagales bacterium]